ncbi:hypothetical protein [Kozakia baliensis]|nr:hypothetical protein [Kozakia baliensis]GBR28325.1 hypothetical protein AA0488_1384 [Kozakia baliensis NRIC 0488]GEL63715.1 hypothetical protein KBA01_10010 [Kozakia baliensis]
MKKFAALLLPIMSSMSAWAADLPTAPLVSPTQDSDITYQMTGPGGQTLHQRMRWNAEHWQQRLDPEGAGTYMLSDYKAHRLVVIDLAHNTKSVSGAPDQAFVPPGTPASGNWEREGGGSVAGQSCTHWRSTDTDGKLTDFCYTPDGLMLSATRDNVVMVQAVSVTRAPQNAAIFQESPKLREVQAAHPGD